MNELVTRYIVVRGDPMTGFRFNGPFVDRNEAIDWVSDNNDDGTWWITEMEGPL